MKLSSAAFEDEQQIPAKYTRDGGNVSPPLTISDVPEAARSLVLILEDLDSPMGVFTHWLVWNIPPPVTGIDENECPPGAELGMNGFGEVRYDGPCPPFGRHRYRFRLLALDQELDATTPDRKDQLEAEMQDHLIEAATLTAWYGAES
jgi:Raf kinase inhibitor-like YbhB/YbcL family protein